MTPLPSKRWPHFFAALLPPLTAGLLQWLAWPLMAPYPWLLFSPAIFLSAWIGGFAGGMAATALSIAIIQAVFIRPFLSVAPETPSALAGAIILVASGVLFSVFHGYLRRASADLALALARATTSESALRQAAIVFDSTSEAIIVTDSEANIVRVNSAYTKITGYQPEEVLGKNPRLHQSGRHDKAFYQRMWDSLRQTGHWQGEIWNRRKNGEIYPAWENISVVRDEQGKVTHHVALLSDITELKQAQERLAHLAHHDPLTGLPNRLLFNASLQQALERARRHRQRLALLFLDLDRFKLVNDSLGHAAGDQLLKSVAERLRKNVRAEDVVARLGGDEFTVILETIDNPDDTAQLARTFIDIIAEPLEIEDQSVQTSTSVGIAFYPDDAETAEDLIKAADAAMYRAKASGRNTYRFHAPQYQTKLLKLPPVQRSLRRRL
jgi:diguanylate cyclase (GGDEF)-like protein/PAS domain S-box-containing protein